MIDIFEVAKNAKCAYLKTMNLEADIKNQALSAIAKKIEQNKALIFEANNKDLENHSPDNKAHEKKEK